MKDFSFVTALHGNERVPVLALASLRMPQVVANPQALRKNVRFIEKDMNASFGTGGDSFEERAARKILAALPADRLVVDFHTFSAQSPPFALIVDLTMLPLAQTAGVEKVIYVKHNFKDGHALLNYRTGISVECGQHNDPASFLVAQKVVRSVRRGLPKKVELYELYGRIDKPGNYRNFELFRDGEEEFYPILAGENAYDFPGLKARKINPGTITKENL